jgi:hypothetical protein
LIAVASMLWHVTLVVQEIAPDWALIMTIAVPRFACMLLPYPPQRRIASPIAMIVIAAVAVTREGRRAGTFPLVHLGKLHNPKANRSTHEPIVLPFFFLRRLI